MKKILIGLLGLILVMTACAPQAQTDDTSYPNPSYPNPSYPNPSYPNDGSSSPNIPVDLTPVQSAAISLLSDTLNLSSEQISLISTEAVTWRDGCMGIVRIGVMCTQAEVPGYKVILDVNGKKYEVHTNDDGSIAQIADGAQLLSDVEGIVIKQLAQNLGLNVDNISVVSDTVIEFPDACLGVSMQYVMCAQVVTPGRIIVLETNGIQYEYHTSEDGSRIQPATFALTWKREGGIAGFCDSLTVFLSGEIYGEQCKSQPNGTMGTFASLLSTSEREQFDTWISQYGQTTLDASDPAGVADGMTLVIEFYGMGKGKPGKSVQGDIFTWVQDLHQKLYN